MSARFFHGPGARSCKASGAATVFPGGKIHESDLRLAAHYPQEDAATRIAGIREALGIAPSDALRKLAAEAAA